MSKCICKPKGSRRDPECKRCHRKGYKAIGTRHDPKKPAEKKQHNALPVRDLPFVRQDVPVKETEDDELEEILARYPEGT